MSSPYDEVVLELVALDLPTSPRLFELVVDQWDRGNAVMILDQRLSDDLKRRHLEAAGATQIIDRSGETTLHTGFKVEQGDALVVMTSGSTGEPRAVVHTHHTIAASAAASNERLGTTGNDHWLLCLPPSHVGGISVFTRCHHNSTRLTIHESFDAERAMDAARHGVTHVSLVLTALRRVDDSLFKLILLGGSAMPDQLPPNVVTTYGLTETMGGVVYDGRPLDGVQVRIVDGEIQLNTPMTMRCYRGGAETPTWFNTGDLGHVTPEGRLVVEGRRGDLIVTGGEKVWPLSVEQVLLEHPAVQECVVRGLPDEEWGARVVAWIVPTTVDPSLDELREWVRTRLSPMHAPKELRLIGEVPRTAIGKVDQPALLAAAWR
ncbi:MAG: 2-succinylbenzoate--CoA ligase [Actinomycetota bacterium]|jgi:O-succinylbenzoic acid--CoA ligase